ncbi:MAG: hypothetical protein RLZZ444_2591 [Pseudomonadota bacterium]|jgi:uncharacterized protein (DUF2336 family)
MMRTKDVVLMATVTTFESMSPPGRNELKQFAELFEPVFKASSPEARRNAVAALTRCAVLPQPVVWFLANQPIELAAIFLTRSPAIDDETLIAVARSQGAAYGKAIGAREKLSVKVLDALVSLRYHPRTETPVPSAEPSITRPADGEDLRERLKDLVRRDTLVRAEETVEAGADIREALMVRFARLGDGRAFSFALAEALGSSRWLSRRMMLDISGRQLGMALMALDFDVADAEFVLGAFYPHLKALDGEQSRARLLLASLDRDDCADRLRAWIRADDYTEGKAPEQNPANEDQQSPASRQAFSPTAWRRARGYRQR